MRGYINPNLDREMRKNLESKIEDFIASGKGKFILVITFC